MPRIRVVTDSMSDLPAELAGELGIESIPGLVNFGGQVFRDRIDLSADEFFERLEREPRPPGTSQSPPAAFEEVYERLAAGGAEGIVSIHIAKQLSGTFNSAWTAAQAFEERLPIAVLDSGSVAMALGWAVVLAARAAAEGASLDEVAATAEGAFPRLRLWATLDTLEYLRRGGRIGAAQALLGAVLKVKPMITVQDGSVQPLERVRTRQRAVGRLVEIAQAEAPFQELAILHTRDPEGAAKLADRLAHLHPREKMVITEIGPVVATHAGPRALGLCAVLSR